MFKLFLCGKFHRHQEDNDIETTSTCSTRKKSKRKFLSRTRNSKNPYADRDLDKFSALLADLEDKKQKIYAQVGSDDISLVRFVFTDSNECKAIVVTSRKKKQNRNETRDTQKTRNSKLVDKQITDHEGSILANEDQYKLGSTRMLKKNWRKPHYYNLLVTIIWILVLLAIRGRSFAILCTLIGWYLVPSIREIKLKHNFKKNKKEG